MGRPRASARAAIAICAAAALAGCGGGEENVDPEALLDRVFSTPVPSSTVEAQLDANLEGISTLGGALRVKVDGPYASGEGARIPSVKWKVNAGVGGLSIGADIISTGEKAFVRYFGETFEVDAARVAAAPRSLADLGIEPRGWFGAARFEGDEEVAGADTHHISAELNERALAGDLRPISSELGSIASELGSSRIEAWIGDGDDIVRQLRVTGGDLKLNVLEDDVGEEETIAAPAPPYQPIEELFDRLPPIPGVSF